MLIDVNRLLRDCYMPCVLTYFGGEIFNTHTFLKNVYDMPTNRNANVKAIYMFSERHNFNTADAELFFLKNGLVILPLFLPTNLLKYAGECALSDAVLTMYSPMLVGLWTKALDRISDWKSDGGGAAASLSPAPVEIYVQRDCAPLKEIRNRVNNHLLNMTYGGGDKRVFKQMNEDTINSVSRTGKSTLY